MNLFHKRHYHKTKTNVGGITVSLKHRTGNLNTLMHDTAVDIIGASQERVRTAIASLTDVELREGTKNAMRTYFKVGNNPSQEQINTVVTTLELTLAGITSDFNLKIRRENRHNLNATPDRTLGYVRKYMRNGEIQRRGDIHISQDILTHNYLGPATFIHEATHKFANTKDHGYMNDTGFSYRENTITTEQCLENADSYAHFAMRLDNFWSDGVD